jgi:succinate dehydrogenase/fumarate reductase flavoprotein subunit
MPVTTTLLLKLRETLGNEAANDLVTWVDEATARELGHIRELAELHYSRFDARLEQRQAELRADLIGRIETLRTEMATQRSDLIKWMFLFWIGTIVPLAGLMVALVKL